MEIDKNIIVDIDEIKQMKQKALLDGLNIYFLIVKGISMLVIQLYISKIN
jgi:hypothetical protein